MKKLSSLLRRITSKHHRNFYRLNCLHSFRTENKLISHEKVCKNKDFSGIVKPSEKDNVLEFNQYIKPDKMPYIIYAVIESLLKKTDACGDSPEHFSATQIGEHIPCGYSMSTIWVFYHIENKHTLHCGKDCMRKFCEFLREQEKTINNFENQKSVSINKSRTKITSRCKRMLYF